MTTTATQPRALEHNILDLSEAIYASQMLLTYCSQRGVSLDTEILATLVEARHIEPADRDAQFEARFWLAFNEAMVNIAPVTIESLAASLGTFNFSGDGSTRAKPKIPAQRAERRYRWGALVVLLSLIVVQGYMDWGRITQTHMQAQQLEQLELEERMAEFVSSSEHPDGVAAMSNPVYERMINERNYVEAGLSNNFGKLESWCFWRAWSEDEQVRLNPYRRYALAEARAIASDKLEHADQPELRQTFTSALASIDRQQQLAKSKQLFSELLVTSGLILTLLQAYVLPLLYGLLGASLHVLRTLQLQIKSVTYSPASDLDFRIHLALGALAGMSVGWLLAPEASGATPLSGFALAFLAGYSVEFLFMLIDGLITKAKSSTGAVPATAKPAPSSSLTPTRT